MRTLVLALGMVVLVTAGCSPAGPPQVTEVTATPRPASAAPSQLPPTATSAPLTGPRATAAALSGMVTLNAPTQAPTDNVGIVTQACDVVRESYVRGDFNGVDWEGICEDYVARAAGIGSDEELYGLLDALIDELNDEHSRFVRPDRFAAEFGLPSDQPGTPGTGIYLWPAREDQHLYMWQVCAFGAAAEAGLVRGDIIQSIYGQQVLRGSDGFDPALYRQAMYGDGTGGSVELTVLTGPGAPPRDIELELGPWGGCEGWFYGVLSEAPRIGYLRVPDFDGNAGTEIRDLIEEMEQDGALEGLIVDVRHNPGGNSDESIGVFTEGVFGTQGVLREDRGRQIWRIRGPVDWNETTPVVVLTDGSSHSAAEYFAIAMQLSGRATIVGMSTAGNTEGIVGFSLPRGLLIRLAISSLELPDGSSIEGSGVQPDVRVPLGMWGLRQSPDGQLQAALELLTAEAGG